VLTRPRDLVLVGLTASGRSAIGFGVARRLGFSYTDTNALLEVHAERTADEIERSSGHRALERAELQAARAAMSASSPVVYACDPDILDLEPTELDELFSTACVVWLDPGVPDQDPDDSSGSIGPDSGALVHVSRLGSSRRRSAHRLSDVEIRVDRSSTTDQLIDEILMRR